MKKLLVPCLLLLSLAACKKDDKPEPDDENKPVTVVGSWSVMKYAEHNTNTETENISLYFPPGVFVFKFAEDGSCLNYTVGFDTTAGTYSYVDYSGNKMLVIKDDSNAEPDSLIVESMTRDTLIYSYKYFAQQHSDTSFDRATLIRIN